MKKNMKKPNIEKFRVAKLTRPDLLWGGDGGDDDGTQGDDTGKKCKMKSIIWM